MGRWRLLRPRRRAVEWVGCRRDRGGARPAGHSRRGQDGQRDGQGRTRPAARAGHALPRPGAPARQGCRRPRGGLPAGVVRRALHLVDVVARADGVPVDPRPAGDDHLLHRRARQPDGPLRHDRVVRRLDALHEHRPAGRRLPPAHPAARQQPGTRRRAVPGVRGHGRDRVGAGGVRRVPEQVRPSGPSPTATPSATSPSVCSAPSSPPWSSSGRGARVGCSTRSRRARLSPGSPARRSAATTSRARCRAGVATPARPARPPARRGVGGRGRSTRPARPGRRGP